MFHYIIILDVTLIRSNLDYKVTLDKRGTTYKVNCEVIGDSAEEV